MNSVNLTGNLTKAPELRTTAHGVSVCTFTVAVNSGFGESRKTDFIPVVTWRSVAENCAKFLGKGNKVGVTGRISTRSYDDSNGIKRYVTEVIANDVDFLTPRDSSVPQRREDKENTDDHDVLGYAPDDFEPLGDDEMPF